MTFEPCAGCTSTRIRHRLLGLGHVRQRLVLDLHQLGGVLGQRARVRDHRGDPFAGIAHAVARQRPARHLRGVDADLQRIRRGAELLAGQHVMHAGHRARGIGVDRQDFRAGMRRGDQRDMLQAGQRDVGGVAAAAGDEARMLLGAALGADVAEAVAGWPAARSSRCSAVRSCHALGGQRDRVDDLLIAGAAAEVAADRVADLVLGRPRVGVEQRLRRDQHSGRAIAALQSMRLAEAVLQDAQLSVRLRQALRRW